MPRDMGNSSQWKEFASDISVRVHATDTPTRITFLMCIHAMHIYMCLPMLHITKIFYGYWLGIWIGWSLCCVWELILFYVYIRVVNIERHDVMFAYIYSARQAGTLLRENVLLAMSSLPLQVSASLVRFGGVTNTEFMTANTIVTVVMSLKNVACGAVLASSPGTHSILIVSVVLVFSAMLPTCSTVYVSSRTVLVAMRTYSENQAFLATDESIADMECDSVHALLSVDESIADLECGSVHAQSAVDTADACSFDLELHNVGAVSTTDTAEASLFNTEKCVEFHQFDTIDAVDATHCT